MAKKRNGKIKISLSTPDNNNVVQLSEHGLPAYHHFVDAPDHSFRLFFEVSHALEETNDLQRKNKRFLRKPSARNPFRIMEEGKKLVGVDIAKTFAVLLSKKVLNNSITNKSDPCGKEHTMLKSFFQYIANIEKAPDQFSKISARDISGWLASVHKGSSATYRLAMKSLISLHPLAKELVVSDIRRPHSTKNSKRINEIDFDEIVKSKDYSEKVHFQILSYVFFEIENAKERLKILENASYERLGDDYIPLDKLNLKNDTIRRLLESGEDGFKKLSYHLYLYLDHPSSEKKSCSDSKWSNSATRFLGRTQEICKVLFKNSENPSENYDRFITNLQSSLPNNWSFSVGATPYFLPYLNLRSKHHEVAIFLYALITLGVNKEVALSWEREVNGKPWFENYDIELGISNKSASRDKKVVLVGVKNKGRTPIVVKKSISINSPLFKFLQLLDKTRLAKRKYIFNIKNLWGQMTAFLNHYPVILDDGSRLKTIETQRFRKSYLGYKTLSLLEGVNNPDDLISKLKEALNHKSFDTTFSSYILKSGMARSIVDSAIVALTTNMLESSLEFCGEIKEDSERSETNETVFLCDCTDPSRPSHGLPIDNKCTRYDMCLGCERSEVYSEHLPAICYRIMQYEKKQDEEPETFKITLEDRMHIAKDTVDKFKIKHDRGVEIVEQAYLIASQAMLDNDLLLPPILQTGAM